MKQGHCLCGEVTLSIPDVSYDITVCHCHMCQRFFGSPFLSTSGLTSDQFQLSGQTSIQRYASSEWAERGFCKTCGSSLFYCSLNDKEYYFPIGLFEQLEGILTNEIFYNCKPEFYSLEGQTVKLTEEEFLTQLFKEEK
ncbi:aldehyde-activating protein [Enterococcus florum]|uniref:Aldehyde-activating protein n=1 Tax=Enterococcus florum TaxID=2480627 RepID=A0A4V0WPU0_9ENTE|nr:GFA family protein [Enterococcus florum]GCF95029.1 aldehyde-activating protein [Enterococcus florum]